MAKQRKLSIFRPERKSTSSLPGTVKDEVETKAKELIAKVLKPKHAQPPLEDSESNYITDISLKWVGSKCFFVQGRLIGHKARSGGAF